MAWVAMLSVSAGLALAGCSDQENRLDCILAVRYHDSVYRPVEVRSTPRPGPALGDAQFGGCRGEPIRMPDSGKLFALPRAGPDQVVLLRMDGHDQVYVNTDVKKVEWPALVTEARRPVECERPVKFIGTVKYVGSGVFRDGRGRPNVPYTATFTSSHGKGLDFAKWSRITLNVRITAKTDPVPTSRFLKKALAVKNPKRVTVTAVCRGAKFDVSTIEFAN